MSPAAAADPPEKARGLPPEGIEVPAEARPGLEEGLKELEAAIASLEALRNLEGRIGELVREHIADVRIFERAVAAALSGDGFFRADEVEKARRLLAEGKARAASLREGSAPWAAAAGLTVRGYVSRIDGSTQPYGLVIPAACLDGPPTRLDVWLHGRDERLSEVNFLDARLRQAGSPAPPGAIVLHPYGRYCNAFKLAGEVDVMEAMESVRSRYRIDPDRISIRGFSMGGAGVWHLAVHRPDLWMAATPGAGFSETREFSRISLEEVRARAPWEETLWALYDATLHAGNLFHCPTVAYSGELDGQRQAAEVMARALREEGMELRHVIGPGTRHEIHRDSAREIEAILSSIAAGGRERMPRAVRFTTHTLRYHRAHWVVLDGLEEHWKRARVEARIAGEDSVAVKTSNITALTLRMAPGACPLDPARPARIEIDGEALEGPRPASDRSFEASLHREGGRWRIGRAAAEGPRKVHGLQGPIDDAFLDSFLFVRPTGKARYPAVEAWARAEMDRAVLRWRRLFRGDCRVKDDAQVTEEDMAAHHLVLWGDPASNSVLARIAAKLPIAWGEEAIAAGERKFAAADHALVLIHPNPHRPDRYVVLNSGPTFREWDDRSNARQVPKLPDWAVIDLSTPPDSVAPGKVAAAGFFGERWELR